MKMKLELVGEVAKPGMTCASSPAISMHVWTHPLLYAKVAEIDLERMVLGKLHWGNSISVLLELTLWYRK